ncbi:MAG: hypothetical protein M0014_11925 [Actinomycetota bacterium]|nr:hypothetical protein [Actinomycetota bacterium]
MGSPKPRRRRHGRRTPPPSRRAASPRVLDWTALKWQSVDRALALFEPVSVVALLSAAVDSPSCGHRLPSLSLLWARAVTRPPDGNTPARPPDLQRLLGSARKTAPQLRFLEDCWQADPRLVVRHPVGEQRLRIHPGAYSDPSQTLRVVASTAAAIDDFVMDRHGFSLSDLLDAALHYCDWRLARIAPAWPTGPLARDEPEPDDEDLRRRIKRIATTPVSLLDEELDAALSTRAPPETWTSRCAHPERAAAAWEWATVASNGLEIALAPGAQTFGAALCIATAAGPRALPAALVISALAAASGLLADGAAGDVASARRMQAITEGRALSMLRPPGQVVPQVGPRLPAPAVDSSPGPGLGMVLLPAARHAFAIAIASSLGARQLGQALDEADAILAGIGVDQVRSSGVPLDASGTLSRLVVYGGPLHKQGPSRNGCIHVHVEDLASFVLDAHQSELGLDLFYQFLDEVTTMPGVDDPFWLDFADVWRHWRRHGVINPTGVVGVALAVDPTPDDTAWRTSAVWEPIDSVLTDAHLPPVSEWYIAKLDEPGQATLWSANREACLVLFEPPLLVSAALDEALSDLGLDPTFALGVADGLLLTCLRSPAVADALAMPGRRPLLVVLGFTTERPPGSSDDHVGIGVSTSESPRPVVDLLLGPDWLELLGAHPRDAHLVLGQALLHCVEQVTGRGPSKEWDAIRASFLAAWEAAPPVAMIHFAETTIDYRAKGQVSLPRSHASSARARRLLARAVLAEGIAPGRFAGDAAAALCRDRIIPAIDAALKELIAPWSKDAVLAVAEHLNDAHGERARAAGELERALAAPWAETWRSLALDAPEAAEHTRPLEVLLELLIADPPMGLIVPDRFDIAEATDLAHLAIEIRTTLAGVDQGIHSLAVLVEDGGITHVIPGPSLHPGGPDAARHLAPLRFDLGSYLAANRKDRFRTRPDTVIPGEAGAPVRIDTDRQRTAQAFRSLSEAEGLPKRLLVADKKMRAACGTGFDGLSAVLGTAVTWRAGDDHVALVPRAKLRSAALEWSQLPEAEIDAALGRLVLDPEALRAEGVSYWEQERRRHRLAISPLALVGEDLVVMPWRIFATQGIYAGYLEDGRLPWHPSDTPDSVVNALVDYRKIANQALEREADDVAGAFGMPHRANIEPHQAAALGLELPGEIDLLVADPSRGRLWVCEVKDVYAAVSPATMRRRLDKFLDAKDGHVAQLSRSARAVAGNPDAAAKLLSAPSPAQPWRVLPLMITRRVEPAAFVEGVSVTFTVLADLADTLRSEVDPESGHTPGW